MLGVIADSASGARGLTQSEAAERLREDGPNELPAARGHGWFAVLFEVIREPMLALLLLCGGVYLALGDKGEAAMLLAFVAVIVAIAALQGGKAERTLDKLRDLSASKALVFRDGREVQVPAKDVVRGDVVVLAEGDRVPADGVALSGPALRIDESLLTGESVAVSKCVQQPVPNAMGRPGGDDTPFVFSGTLVTAGKGEALVLETGRRTQIGLIGKALSAIVPEPARVQIETAQLVRRLAIAGILISLGIAIVYGLERGAWLQAALVGIALAMAILPEELPVVLSAYLGLGAWRMAKHGVLARHMPAVETLGSATVLCVDKTGTVTENRMSVGAIVDANGAVWHRDGSGTLPEGFHDVLEFGVLSSHRDPFDPTERAIAEALTTFLGATEHVHTDWTLCGEYPLSRTILATSRVWSKRSGGERVVAAKGAPEAIADLCHLAPAQVASLIRSVNALAAAGLRVLGVARSTFPVLDLPISQHDFPFVFVGLIGLEDPVRASVPAAIREARTAGIRTIMITGDYPATARAIAEEIGLANAGHPITGVELDAMGDAELSSRIKVTSVFCRVVPEQKLRIIAALKSDGEIVAMTGDGVNDAPALRSAHVGIAMGKRGTDVARESASLVLLNDDFGSIIEAIKQGRRIFDNLHKAINFVVAAHIPIIGMSIIPVVFGMPLLLLPIHILFLQLIIDPACSIAFEAEPPDPTIMSRPPRDVNERLFDRATIWTAAVQGGVILLTVAGLFWGALLNGRDEETARALAFSAMVLSSISLLFVSRLGESGRWPRSPNAAMIVIAIGAIALLTLAETLPELRKLFGFGAFDRSDMLYLALAWIACFAGLLFARRLTARFRPG